MVSRNTSRTPRLLLIGAVAVAAGFAIGSLARGPETAHGRPSYPDAMTAEQMHAAMSEALLMPDTFERALAIDALVERLDAENVEGMGSAIDPVVVGLDECDVKPYFHKRAQFDPHGAFEHAMSWSSVYKRGVGIYATTFTWALEGGALEARSFVESIEAIDTHKAGLTGLLLGWARSGDVDGITQFLMNLPDDPAQTRNDVLTTYLTGTLVAHGGPDRLIDWFDTIPDDAPNDFQRAAFRNALLQLASDDPARAIAFREANADREYAAGTMWMITVSWQKLDPEAAFEWVLARPEGPDRMMAATRAMQRWFSRDRRAATSWLLQKDLGHEPELRKRLYGITKQAKRLRQMESDA